MLGNPPSSTAEDNHWFVLKSPITLKSDGTVEFRLWTWGESVQDVTGSRSKRGQPKLTKTEFERTYFGYLIGKR
jgi:2-keto-3-deoxy-galactonokinase